MLLQGALLFFDHTGQCAVTSYIARSHGKYKTLHPRGWPALACFVPSKTDWPSFACQRTRESGFRKIRLARGCAANSLKLNGLKGVA